MKTKEEAGYRRAYQACCNNCQHLSDRIRNSSLVCMVVEDVYFNNGYFYEAQDAFEEGQLTGMFVCDAFELHTELEGK